MYEDYKMKIRHISTPIYISDSNLIENPLINKYNNTKIIASPAAILF